MMGFRYMRDFDIERPDSDFPDYKRYFDEDDRDDEEVFVDDDIDEF